MRMRPDALRQEMDDGDSKESALVDAAWAQFQQMGGTARTRRLDTPGSLSFPGYRVLGEIHRGGQGVVYQAIHESTRRKVAIKIMKEGPLADATEMARFDREVDILSRINHPHIVTMHDRGSAAGHAFYVMDYVAGNALDAHVAGAELSVDQVLALFVKICDAVNVAHLRGVIHRDLKPGNIRIDEEGQPRILDFGLAKVTLEAGDNSSAHAMTLTGQFVGSLPWASPEQAEGRSERIDLRTDVYSLGVILYQLLTGKFPYPVAGRIDDVVRHIVQTRPARPTINLRAMDRDLEIILLKCLSKEPERRYQSAGELARDVRHFLAHEPVSATPPSATYRIRKLIQRHRTAALATTTVFVALVVATAVSITFALRASRALVAAEDQRILAERNAQETREVARFQSSLLSGIDVNAMGSGFKKLFREQVLDDLTRRFVGDWPNRRKLTPEEVAGELAVYDRVVETVQPVDVARRLLDDYVLGNDIHIVKTRFAHQPRVQAELLDTLGSISRVLGLNADAVEALRYSLELRQAEAASDPVALADTISQLAAAIGAAGNAAEAESLHRAALDLYRVHLGERHVATIKSMCMIGVNTAAGGDFLGAEAILREALDLARGLPAEESATLALVLHNLGGALQSRGELNPAEGFIREALEIRRTLPESGSADLADTITNMAGNHYFRKDYERAGQFLIEALDIKRAILGGEHVEIATLLNNLGGVKRRQGDRASAKVYYAEALAMYRRLLGDEHPDVALTLNNLAMMHQMDGDLATSGPMLQEVLALRRRILSADHPDLALTIANVALQFEEEQNLVAAEPLYREAVAIDAKKLAPCHSWRVSAEIGLLRTLLKQGRLDEMERLLGEFYGAVDASDADEHCRSDYYKSYVRLYEIKHGAAPDQGFDRMAEEWSQALAATTQPSTTP
jgi:non-specific serine/threonine protein kinase/serine/threonine-protein kinase